MRRSSDTNWVHLQCKNYKGLKFVNEAFLDKDDHCYPVKGLDNIDDSAFCLKCNICGGIMTGFCVNCSEPACVLSFHPFCAIKSGFTIKPPLISCQEHSSPQKTEIIKMPAHKIKEQRRAQTKQLNFYYHQTRPIKKKNRSRNTKTDSDFHKVDEYFSSFPSRILIKSTLPYDKNAFSLPGNKLKTSSRCRVLFQGFLKDFLLNFKINRKEHTTHAYSDDFIIIPRIEEPKELKNELSLYNYSMILKDISAEYELLSRCLNETISAEDEITKEILYLLEYFSRKIIPVVNTNKELLSKYIERSNKLDMENVYSLCNDS